jgi:hypothetical protein
MFPAIAYEGCTGFDAMSRSLNYIFSRPWRMIFYTIVADLYGALCYAFVRLFVFILLASTYFILSLGVMAKNSNNVNKLLAIWPKPEFTNLAGILSANPANWSQTVSYFIIKLAILVVIGLLAAFIISFYFSINTIIYSLMRYKAEDIPTKQVHTLLDDVTQ